MSFLAWYVVYGNWIWLAMLCVGALATIGWFWWRPRRSARQHSKSELDRMGSPFALEEAKEGELLALSGTIGVDGDPTCRFEDGEPAVVTSASPSHPEEILGAMTISRCGEGLFLDINGVKVGLEGAAEVRTGSRELHLGHRFSRTGAKLKRALAEIDDDAFDAMSKRSAALRTLSEGDRARAQGFLRRLPASETSDSYRAPADRWVLTADPDPDAPASRERVVTLAFEGTPLIHGPTARAMVINGFLAMVAVAMVTTIIGYILLIASGNMSTPSRQCQDPDITTPLVIATVLPFARTTATRRWAEILNNSCELNEEIVQQRAALWELSGDCGWGTTNLWYSGAPESAVNMASRCQVGFEELDRTVGTLYRFGSFTKASELLDHHPIDNQASTLSRIAIVSHALSGHTENARQVARARLKQLGRIGARAEFDVDRTSSQTQGANLTCLNETLAAQEGDTEAIERLRKVASVAPDRSVCPLLLASQLEGAERLEALKTAGLMPTLFARHAEMLVLEAELDQGIETASWKISTYPLSLPPSSLFESQNTHFARFTGLDQALLKRLDGLELDQVPALQSRASLRARASLFEFYTGDFEAARTLAAAALEDVEALGSQGHNPRGKGSWHSLSTGRLAVMEIAAGNRERAEALIKGLTGLPSTDQSREPAAAMLTFLNQGDSLPMVALNKRLAPWEEGLRFWALAASGDGSKLCNERSDRLNNRRIYLPSPMPPIWVGGITTKRAELAACARWHTMPSHNEYSLSDSLFDVSWSWQLATALEEDGWAEELVHSRRRLYEAVLDRDSLMVLVALGAL